MGLYYKNIEHDNCDNMSIGNLLYYWNSTIGTLLQDILYMIVDLAIKIFDMVIGTINIYYISSIMYSDIQHYYQAITVTIYIHMHIHNPNIYK